MVYITEQDCLKNLFASFGKIAPSSCNPAATKPYWPTPWLSHSLSSQCGLRQVEALYSEVEGGGGRGVEKRTTAKKCGLL
jgi:hypothetical protein